MTQATLKLKMSMQNVDIMNNNIEVQKIILMFLLSILGGLAFIYVLILGNTVLNIVERRSLEKEMTALSNEVREHELTYLALSNDIDLKLSAVMGFKEIKTTFATRKDLGSINFVKNEI